MGFKSKLSNKIKGGKQLKKKLLRCSRRGHQIFNYFAIIIHNAIYNEKHGRGPKISPSKQILSKLPTTLAQVKAGNTSANLLNEIRQIIYSLYQAK